MSSDLGMTFGESHHEQYAEVIEAWASTAAGQEITDAMVEKWGADLYAALSEDLIEALVSKSEISEWSGKGISMPSPETLKRFSQIAAKYSLQYASKDLLERLVRSATFDKENPQDVITAAIRPMRPAALVKRAPLTVAQIFDMAKDKYTNILSNQLARSQQFTGRRRWIAPAKNSRHAALNYEIRGPGEYFTYNTEKVAAPRPVGGPPASWSNCSCYLEYETKKGGWVG